ncbi:MAG TPA: hypothetical protein VN706_15270 [Gemmatimonadaceae bacterium]|nr:hypothetical protein [Gemmatimonadaceae bacterium]
MPLSELEVGPLVWVDVRDGVVSPLDPTVLAQCKFCGYFVQTHLPDACECGRIRCTVVGDRAQVVSSADEPEYWRPPSDAHGV